MTVTLRPMTPAEFESTIDSAFAAFLTEWVNTGRIEPANVPAEIKRQRAQVLPDGIATQHMLLFIAEVDAERIGWLWIALPGGPHGHADAAWVFNVEVDDAYRSRGYGKGLMLAAEGEVAKRGVKKLGLNVFARNRTAVHLYERLGYEVISQQMTKTIDA